MEGTTLSLGGGQPGSDFYSAAVRAAIEPRWRKPVLGSETPSEVTVSFEILRDGTVQGVQVRWIDPVPQAGTYRLASPKNRSLELSFARVDVDTIAVTLKNDTKSFTFNVNSLGAVAQK